MRAEEARELYLKNKKHTEVCCPISTTVTLICENIEAEAKLGNYWYMWFHPPNEQNLAAQIGIQLSHLGYYVQYHSNHLTIVWK